MKIRLRSKFNLFSSAAMLVVCSTSIDAGTAISTFSFQKGDLQKDGAAYGIGSGYGGVIDGRITDSSATSALVVSTGIIGKQNQSGNGQDYVGLFSYDLTELGSFITANTSATSTVTVSSVSFKLVSSGGSAAVSGTPIRLYQTDPFTSSARWNSTDGTTAWSAPFQNINSTTIYGHTGGGSILGSSLGGTSPTVTSTTVTSGNALNWTSSAAFVGAITNALGTVDKKLYLTANCPLSAGNSDSRVNFNTSNATTVDNRPELLITVVVNSYSDWTGASSPSWATAGNWTSAPAAGDPVRFNSSSTANLATVLDQNFDLSGVAVIDPVGPVSIGGANTLTLGGLGLDLSAATQNLTITAPLSLSAAQTWNVAGGRTLAVGGAVTGSGVLTIAGTGNVTLGAAGVLPGGVGAGGLTVSGNLDLNGFSQSINGLSGGGVIDNTAAGASTLTVGNSNTFSNFTGTIQDTGGDLSVVKVGTAGINLLGSSSFAGGFTNNGSGNIAPQNSNAFGTGPVVINNAVTVYPTNGSYTFANDLTLNGATLRQGGGNNRLLTWSGPVSVTSDSTIQSDGSTAGVTLSGAVTLSGGATLSSAASGTAHSISGSISGDGGLTVTSGTLNLTGANTYNGATTVTAGTLRLNSPGSISAASVVAVNGTSTIGGSGTIGGSVTVAANATVAPGAAGAVGTLSIGGGFDISAQAAGSGKLGFQLTSLATASDQITVGGTFTIGAGVLGFNNFTFANSGGLQAGTYKLITSGGITGTLDGADLIGTIGTFSASLRITGGDLELVVVASGYESWKAQITNGLDLRTDDADGDSFTNLQEFLFGTSPISGNGSLVTTTTSGGNLVLRWLQRESGATYQLTQSSTLAAASWTNVVSPVPAMDANQTGAPADYDYHTVTLPTNSEKAFFRIDGLENN